MNAVAAPALPRLPVDEALPQLAATLAGGGNAILSAPPGSGKTTRVPLALLDEPWLAGGKILLLEPRRLAARAAARFMAHSLGEAVGDTVGFRVRMERQVSQRTRVEVLTEGMLTRRLQRDPELAGVGLVIFDEFHERSLQADMGLALCLDTRQGLREDLRLLVMSATLELEPLCGLLGDAALVTAAGRSYPVETLYDPGPAELPAAQMAVRGALRALREREGDLLVFLPGMGEIRSAESLLRERLEGTQILIRPLYGDLDSAAQDSAIRPDPQGRRRVVLATSIAESSLTIEGVSLVVDTGWSRLPRFDPNTGLTRLTTLRVSRAAAEQRRGRAGRLGPGVCYRLWSEALTLNPHGGAEILQADLAPLLLEIALWGVDEPAGLSWLDAPPAGAMAQARKLLQRLEALDRNRRITPLGRRMAALPLHPRLAHMLLRAGGPRGLSRAADLAALLSERDIFQRGRDGLRSHDLEERLAALADWRKPGKNTAYPLNTAACRRVDRVSRQLRSLAGLNREQGGEENISIGALVASAYPERVAQRRGASGGSYLLANGRGATLAEEDPLAGSPYLAVAAMDAGVREGRIFLAARLEPEQLESLFGERITESDHVRWDAGRRMVSARRELRLDALVLERKPLPRPVPERLLAVLLEGIRREGADALSWSQSARDLQARMLCLRHWEPEEGWPDLSDQILLRDLEQWLAPWLDGVTGIAQLGRLDLASILRQDLGWERQQLLDELVPERIAVPSGSRRSLSYVPGEPPVLAVKLQEMFGQRDTPRVCRGRVPVTLHLLSPARRPLQITQDLAGFWDRTYAEVRKEMKGRYPKHYWPEDPVTAVATARVRPKSQAIKTS